MTTAHRPTWAPAKGGEEQGGARWFVPSVQRSAKNQAGQLTLKFRQNGQSTTDDISKRDLLTELEIKERKHVADTKGGLNFEEERKKDLLLLESLPDGGGGGGKGGGGGVKQLVPRAADADEEDADAEESSSSDDDDDDEEDLLAELERIKKERAEEAAKKAKEAAVEASKSKEAELRSGNPLLPIAATEGGAFSVKRRWDDDVVFKNQARGEPKATKRFINDTIRSDFHKKFLNRYVR